MESKFEDAAVELRRCLKSRHRRTFGDRQSEHPQESEMRQRSNSLGLFGTKVFLKSLFHIKS